MIAKFKAAGIHTIQRNGPRTLIYGEILEGLVSKGMWVSIPFSRSISIDCLIEAVEFTNFRENAKRNICLVLKCANGDEDQTLLDMLDFENEILEIYRYD
ncbi:MAG: hypothetical protein ACQ9MH_24915 [Nitrospinales bacterium]